MGETDNSFDIEWKGLYRMEGPAFVYADRETDWVTTTLGYQTQKIAHVVRFQNFQYFRLGYWKRGQVVIACASCYWQHKVNKATKSRGEL